VSKKDGVKIHALALDKGRSSVSLFINIGPTIATIECNEER